MVDSGKGVIPFETTTTFNSLLPVPENKYFYETSKFYS